MDALYGCSSERKPLKPNITCTTQTNKHTNSLTNARKHTNTHTHEVIHIHTHTDIYTQSITKSIVRIYMTAIIRPKKKSLSVLLFK